MQTLNKFFSKKELFQFRTMDLPTDPSLNVQKCETHCESFNDMHILNIEPFKPIDRQIDRC